MRAVATAKRQVHAIAMLRSTRSLAKLWHCSALQLQHHDQLRLLAACRYGFVVFADPDVTDVACAGLNGMRMGERVLTVRRATEVRDVLPSALLH